MVMESRLSFVIPSFPLMSEAATKKQLLSPALQAKLLQARVVLIGLARDFWKDAPMPWPRWVIDIKKKIAAKMAAQKTASTTAAKKPDAASSAQATESVKQAAPSVVKPEVRIWTADRVGIVEAMWGEGHSFPGGDEYNHLLTSPAAINSEKSVLDLSAGLGALARHAVDEFKTYVTGMEMDSALAARAMIMSIAAGKSKTASIVNYDPATYTASRKYDCIFARELFYRIIGKEKFFKAIDSSLKTGGGMLIFTDFILDADMRSRPAVVEWLARERGVAPISMIEMIKTWKGMGYDLRIAEDQTQLYKENILKGLKNLAVFMMTNQPDRETKMLVVREVDLWAKRLAAFHEGLRYGRFLGIKY